MHYFYLFFRFLVNFIYFIIFIISLSSTPKCITSKQQASEVQFQRTNEACRLTKSFPGHRSKCLTQWDLRLKYLQQRPQQNRLTSEWTRQWDFRSASRQKRFGHSLQTYGFTSSWRWSECSFRLPRVMNCCWQMSHVNQVQCTPLNCISDKCIIRLTA